MVEFITKKIYKIYSEGEFAKSGQTLIRLTKHQEDEADEEKLLEGELSLAIDRCASVQKRNLTLNPRQVSLFSHFCSDLRTFNDPIDPLYIQQGQIANCGFISALVCVLASHHASYLARLVSNQTVRLFVSGAWVAIYCSDAALPVSTAGHFLCAHVVGSIDKRVDLLEYGNLCVFGSASYSNAHSNPVSDLVHLTGWVPETLKLKSITFDSVINMFKRTSVMQNDHKPNAIVCIGTAGYGAETSVIETVNDEHFDPVSGIVYNHCYSVLAIDDSTQQLLLRNPWRSHAWAGYQVEAEKDKRYKGCFWIPWTHMKKLPFSNVYIVWNPASFRKVVKFSSLTFHDFPVRVAIDRSQSEALLSTIIVLSRIVAPDRYSALTDWFFGLEAYADDGQLLAHTTLKNSEFLSLKTSGSVASVHLACHTPISSTESFNLAIYYSRFSM